VLLPTGERAAKVLVADHYLDEDIPAGEAHIYLYTPTGATLDLQDAVFAHLEQTQRPVGVKLTIMLVTPITHDISIELDTDDPDALPVAEAAARAHIAALSIGEGIDVNRLTSA